MGVSPGGTSTVTTVVESGEDLDGFVHDPINIKIHCASYDYDSCVHRVNLYDSGIETSNGGTLIVSINLR